MAETKKRKRNPEILAETLKRGDIVEFLEPDLFVSRGRQIVPTVYAERDRVYFHSGSPGVNRRFTTTCKFDDKVRVIRKKG